VTEPVPLILAVLLVASSISALLVRRLLWSLILLFYSSLILGGILFWYGAVYAGLFHIITFAGAVSVLFMIILMLVGQDQPETGSFKRTSILGMFFALIGTVLFMVVIEQLVPAPNRIAETSIISATSDDLSFLWNYWSWSIVFVVVPLTAAVLVLVNLFSKEGEVE
jgi:NADH:ubiquinone oxidoreductase subunit 6 (subunit J)